MQSTQSAESRPPPGSKASDLAQDIWAGQTTGNKWRLLALSPNSKKPLAGSDGYKGATKSPKKVEAWPEHANIAVTPDGTFFLFDVDGEDGLRRLQMLKRQLGPLPRTVAVQTPKGFHLYFEVPEGKAVESAIRFDEGIDIISVGRYAVLPGSVTQDGKYDWICHPHDTDIAALPESWLEWLSGRHSKRGKPALIEKKEARRKPKKSSPKPTWAELDDDIKSALNDGKSVVTAIEEDPRVFWQRIFETVPTCPGTRNSQLLKLAQVLARYFDPTKTHADALQEIVAKWWKAARRVSGTSWHDNWREFQAVWRNTKWSPRFLQDHWAKAAKEFTPYWLQTHLRNKPELWQVFKFMVSLEKSGTSWFLGCRELASVAGISKSKAQTLLKELEKHGLTLCTYRGRSVDRKSSTWNLRADEIQHQVQKTIGQHKLRIQYNLSLVREANPKPQSLPITCVQWLVGDGSRRDLKGVGFSISSVCQWSVRPLDPLQSDAHNKLEDKSTTNCGTVLLFDRDDRVTLA